jgi:4-amino-4-deoxy-L-arabinose transferase-like glycosyltransferase
MTRRMEALSVSRTVAGERAAVRATLLLIAAATAVRLVFAASIGLGIDESYMVAAGRELALSYFDHPPLAWWLARGAALLFGSEAPVVVRLPFVLLAAGTTWLLFRLGALLFGARAGFFTALAFTLAPVFGVTSATWVLPDGPLDFALAGFALALAHALFGRPERAAGWWLLAGLCGGVALMSKYSAVITFAGLAVFLTSRADMRRWFAHPAPYAAAVLGLLLFTPVVAWNAAHGWASFGFQAGRAAAAGLRPWMPFVVVLGGALFLLPWIFAPLAAATVAAARRGPPDGRRWFLVCLGLGPVLVFALVAAWSRGVPLFHWAAPGYLLLLPLLGDLVARAAAAGRSWVRPWAWGSAAFVLAGLALVVAEVRFGLASRLSPAIAAARPAMQARDWTALRAALAERGLADRPGLFVAAAQWHVAGKVDYALGGSLPVVCLCRDARQYGLVRPAVGFVGRDAILVAPAGGRRDPAEAFAPWFERLEPLPPVAVGEGMTLDLWYGRDFGGDPAGK